MNYFLKNTLIAMAAVAVSCCTPKEGEDIIGKSTVEVIDGKMTPEILVTMSKVSAPQISPDGKKILYTVGYTDIAQNKGNSEIFVMNADGTGRTQLTKDASSYSNTIWIEGGKGIAQQCEREKERIIVLSSRPAQAHSLPYSAAPSFLSLLK